MDDAHERRWNFWHWLGIAVVAYVIPCVVLLVDTFLFNAILFEALPTEVQSFLNLIYGPVGKIARFLGWVQD